MLLLSAVCPPNSNTASVRYSAWRRPSRKVTSHRIKRFTRELYTQARIVVAAEPLAQILSGNSVREIAAQQALYRIGNLRSYAAIAQRSSRSRILSHGSANAEIERIDELAFVLYLLPFDTDVGDLMLSTAIRATGDVQFELLVELGNAQFHLFHQPPREGLGLRDGQLAKLGSSAGNRSSPEGTAIDMQIEFIQFLSQTYYFFVGDVDEEKILHHGSSQSAASVAVGQIRCCFKLFPRDPASENRGSHEAQASLLLPMDANVIAQDVVWRNLRHCRIELISKTAIEL